jgi:hypothetical protein
VVVGRAQPENRHAQGEGEVMSLIDEALSANATGRLSEVFADPETVTG